MRTPADPIAPLFRSDAQAKLLAQLFLSRHGDMSLTDLSSSAGVAYERIERSAAWSM